jgi:hypothetical protein
MFVACFANLPMAMTPDELMALLLPFNVSGVQLKSPGQCLALFPSEMCLESAILALQGKRVDGIAMTIVKVAHVLPTNQPGVFMPLPLPLPLPLPPALTPTTYTLTPNRGGPGRGIRGTNSGRPLNLSRLPALKEPQAQAVIGLDTTNTCAVGPSNFSSLNTSTQPLSINTGSTGGAGGSNANGTSDPPPALVNNLFVFHLPQEMDVTGLEKLFSTSTRAAF